MRKFEIRYNDGVFAESIVFNNNHSDDFVEKYLLETIQEYNTNINSLYHITRENIKEIINY